MNKYNCIILTVWVLLFFNCKTAKTIVSNGELSSNLSTKQIVKEVKRKASNFKTLSARLKIETDDGKKKQSVSVSMRMEKDKTIWISKLGIVKALITPKRIAFYNTWDNTYFDGDFSYLSELLGTDLDFNKVQNLILGEAILELDSRLYKSEIHEKSYMLQPKNQLDLYEVLFLFNPTYFKLDSQEIYQEREGRLLKVDYFAYQKKDTEILPKEVKIIAVQKNEELKVNLEYKSVSLNENLRFPFKIPSGFKEIKL